MSTATVRAQSASSTSTSPAEDGPAGQIGSQEGQPRPPSARREPGPGESGEFRRAANWKNPRVATILETAAACFSKGGFTATTLADIGKELGLRKSIVHYYFASKAALVHEVQSLAYSRYLDIVRDALSSPLKAGDGAGGAVDRTRVSSGFRQLWRRLAEDTSIRGLNIELWSEGRRDAELSGMADALQVETHRLLTEHLREAGTREDVSAEDLATLTLAVLDGLTVLAERESTGDRAARAFEAYVQLLQCPRDTSQ
jgi:AcrR family transcriptional regulator